MKRTKHPFPATNDWRRSKDKQVLDDAYFQSLHDKIMNGILQESLVTKQESKRHLSLLNLSKK